jgi:uncharacterized protein (TIGR02145 family)
MYQKLKTMKKIAQAKKKTTLLLSICFFGFLLRAQQPANTCATLPPSLVPCSHSNVAFSVNQDGNAFDEINASCATGSDYSDGWYSVAGDGGIITVSVGLTNNLESCLSVYSGCATGEIGCVMVPGASAAQSVTFQSTNGSNYYIQIQRRSGSSSANLSGYINVKSQGSANINYSASSFCSSTSVAQTVNLTGTGPFSGGTFTSTPSGLSLNSINGSIVPNLSTPGTYTVTYKKTGSNGCSNITATSTITIENQTTPLFTQLGPYLSGASIPALPTTSSNGISGTWSPAISNTATTTYTFTPNAEQCVTTTTMTITINQPLQVALAANDSTVCAGTSITLVVNIIGAYREGTVHCNSTPTAVVDVTNPVTGKTWMDRNLGASQVATSSTDINAYGDLYQWGRRSDGHQCRTSPTTSTLSSVDQPANGNFIIASTTPFDWRSPQNTNLWQGVDGVNNPCPSGYRLPTETEFNAERLSWSANTSVGAYASLLKLPLTGFRLFSNGSLNGVGSYVYYWSSTVSGTNSRYLVFSIGGASMDASYRALGGSVRCLKD